MSWIDDWVRPGMTVLDLGANHGLYTKQFVEAVGPTGTVIAIEPNPDLAPILVGLTPHVLSLAVGDHDGDAPFYFSAQPEHGSCWIANVLVYEDRCERLRIATLDTLQRTGEVPVPIDAVKADLQGAEAAMLRGATDLLTQQRPVWFIEIWPEGLRGAGDSADAICETFRAAHYRPDGFADYDALLAATRTHTGHSSLDALFVPEER